MKIVLLVLLLLTGVLSLEVIQDENFQAAQKCVDHIYPSAAEKCLSRIELVQSLGKRCRLISAALLCLLQESHENCGDKGDKVLIARLSKSGEMLPGEECKQLQKELSDKFVAEWGTYHWQQIEKSNNAVSCCNMVFVAVLMSFLVVLYG